MQIYYANILFETIKKLIPTETFVIFFSEQIESFFDELDLFERIESKVTPKRSAKKSASKQTPFREAPQGQKGTRGTPERTPLKR